MFEILAKLLSFFFQLTNSYGFAIILLTVAVRLLLFPLTAKQTRSMAAMSRVQPQVKKLQAEHKDDRQKLNEELMKFYKQEGINPAAGCLPLVLQIPVFIGLFRVIKGLSHAGPLSALQINVPKPNYLSANSDMYRSIVRSGGKLISWGFDLAQSARNIGGDFNKRLPYVLLVVVYAASGWIQQSMATKRNPSAATGPGAQMQQIMKVFPIFMGIFSYNMPAGLVVYWLASNLWTIGQQEILFRSMPPVESAESSAAIDVVSSAKKPLAVGKASGRRGKVDAKSVDAKSVDAKSVEVSAHSTVGDVRKAKSPKVAKDGQASGRIKVPPVPAPLETTTVGREAPSRIKGPSGAPQGSRPAKPQAAKKKGS